MNCYKNEAIQPVFLSKKKKSRRTADTFPRAYEVAALRNQSRRFFLLFQRCSCDQEGGI
jgi:hypothetical protein